MSTGRFGEQTLGPALLGLAGLAFASGVLGETADRPGPPLDQAIKDRMAQTRQHHAALLEVRQQLNQQLAEIERRQSLLARNLSDLDQQLSQHQRRIRDIKARCADLEKRLAEQQTQLVGQSRSAQAIGRKDWLKLLLNQEDASHLARVLAFYAYLGRARSAVIDHIKADLADLERLTTELNDEMILRNALRQKAQVERSALSDSAKARKQLLRSWDRTLKEQSLQMQEDQQQLDAMLDLIVAQAPAEGAASSPAGPRPSRHCPPQGPVAARFGSPRMTGRWDGLLIEGKEGAPVRAVASGRVVFADWFRGYGLLMIVDHGQGIMSLYAFNRTLDRQKGDPVVAGDVIATLGSSGGRDRPGLYFGVRDQGKPIDPLIWCKGASLH